MFEKTSFQQELELEFNRTNRQDHREGRPSRAAGGGNDDRAIGGSSPYL